MPRWAGYLGNLFSTTSASTMTVATEIKNIDKRMKEKRKRINSPEAREKMRLAHLGKKMTVENKEKLLLANKGKKRSIATRLKISISRRGNKSNLWKGGITPKNDRNRFSFANKLWREAVLKRDNNTCTWCGSKENLTTDHIKPWGAYPKLRFDISNGRTLCFPCHYKTETWGKSIKWQILNKK